MKQLPAFFAQSSIRPTIPSSASDNAFALGLVVERDVARHDRRLQGRAGLRDPEAGCSSCHMSLGALGVAKFRQSVTRSARHRRKRRCVRSPPRRAPRRGADRGSTSGSCTWTDTATPPSRWPVNRTTAASPCRAGWRSRCGPCDRTGGSPLLGSGPLEKPAPASARPSDSLAAAPHPVSAPRPARPAAGAADRTREHRR